MKNRNLIISLALLAGLTAAGAVQAAGKIYVGAKEFQCMGARDPFDHPHVYLDMGSDAQVLCPYCSTLYVHDPRLGAADTEPKGCLVDAEVEGA